MARRFTIEMIMDLATKIGANPAKLASRGNISFFGTGPQKNPLFQRPLPGLERATPQNLGSRDSLIEATEDAARWLKDGKLNSIQTEILGHNLSGIDRILHPPPLPMASISKLPTRGTGITSTQPYKSMLPEPGSELAELGVTKEKAMAAMKGMAAELPEKTHSARATMIRLLDVYAGGQEGVGVTLREIMSPQELKWLMEGGGGATGDPVALFAKYFGPVAARNLPTRGTPEVIEEFSRKLIKMKDSMGRKIDDPFFNPDDIGFAEGGLAKILEVNNKVNRHDLM